MDLLTTMHLISFHWNGIYRKRMKGFGHLFQTFSQTHNSLQISWLKTKTPLWIFFETSIDLHIQLSTKWLSRTQIQIHPRPAYPRTQSELRHVALAFLLDMAFPWKRWYSGKEMAFPWKRWHSCERDGIPVKEMAFRLDMAFPWKRWHSGWRWHSRERDGIPVKEMAFRLDMAFPWKRWHSG